VNGNSVEHYYNNGFSPELLSQSNPTIGLSNSKIIIDQNYFSCFFSRANSYDDALYFNINNNDPYILIAFGNNSFGFGSGNYCFSYFQ
jgi:hypothetical protein